MFFWNSPAFSMIQQMLAIWSLVPLPFLKPAWTSGISWLVHILLKPGLENFEHYFPSMWDEFEHSLRVVWAFVGIAFLWDWNWKLTFSSPVTTAEFSKLASIYSFLVMNIWTQKLCRLQKTKWRMFSLPLFFWNHLSKTGHFSLLEFFIEFTKKPIRSDLPTLITLTKTAASALYFHSSPLISFLCFCVS